VASTRPAAFLLVFVAAIVLIAYPLIVAVPFQDPPLKGGTVHTATGTAIVIEGTCAAEAVTLIDPDGVGHAVGRGVQRSTAGGRNTTWYLFRYGGGTPEYWITNEPAMLFSDTYLEAVDPFPAAGIWEVGIDDGDRTVRLRVRVGA
jgi:hypothetical protein